jgi:8-oxo-dGTP pyrophosphatase MutT (NUDIX family)
VIAAASLILVRDSAEADPQILMVERSAAMAFAAGAFVFPGGRVDPADEAMAARIGRPGDAGRIAAIRECIEESAVAAGLGPCPGCHLARELQDELLGGKGFDEILDKRGLELDLDAVTPFARWQPGPEVSRRFDTSFFIARAPEGEWTPRAASGECVSARWVSASAMLDEEALGATKLIFPTRKNLERLALHGSFAEMLADALRYPVAPITPVIEEFESGMMIRIPEGRGYPVTLNPIEKADRG